MENNGEQLKLSASVLEVLKPIIYDMTRVNYLQQSSVLGQNNEPDWVKNAKRSCCHVILDSTGTPTLSVSRRDDGNLYCDACNRRIGTHFDASAVTKLQDALQVVNQALLFGILYGLDAPSTASLVSVKSVLPDVIQLMSELNERVANKQNVDSTLDALGKEYDSRYTKPYNDAFSTIRR